MNEQAERLKHIVDDMKIHRKVFQKSRVITITSGKGGVGKTNITVNLAIDLAFRGYKVIIIDADFGLSNVDVMLGKVSKYSFADLLNYNQDVEDILSTGPAGVRFISGGSGAIELINMSPSQLNLIIDKLAILDHIAEIILIDTGAGIDANVMRFIQAADETIVVITPEPASLTDAYALVKTAVGLGNKTPMYLIVNRVNDKREAEEIISRFCAVTQRFLGFAVETLGFLTYDEVVIKAVKQQQPFIMLYPQSRVAKQIYSITDKLLKQNTVVGDAIPYRGFKGFLIKLLRGIT